jgi:hypothetical protein
MLEPSPYEVSVCLCRYDPRNPLGAAADGDDDDGGLTLFGCSCDNCFYGRHRLADALLRFMGIDDA